MSRINDLIQELCPDGVEHRYLAELGEFFRGHGLQKKDFTDHGIGCIHYGQIYTHYGLFADHTISYVNSNLADTLQHAKTNDLIIAATSENDEDLCKAVAWLGNGEIVISGDSFIFRHTMNPKYIAYVFQSSLFQTQKAKFITGTKVRRLNAASIGKIVVPIPPLEVQEEIVRILDSFTSLETELEAELEARKQQYTYLRNKLITKKQGSTHLLLGDIADIGTGSHDTKEAILNGKYTFFARGREPLRLDTFDFDETSIITAGDGVGVGKVFHFAHGKYALHQRAYRIVPYRNVDSKYIYYYLVAKFPQYLQQVSVHSSVTSLRRPMLLRFPLCLPSISEQHRVATILDKFETFQANFSCGIPAEIEARRKQYEYYRDRLLTFKELDHE